ncbi:MAG: hypothetical protein WCJ01_09555 [Ignavibacteria bacterium]
MQNCQNCDSFDSDDFYDNAGHWTGKGRDKGKENPAGYIVFYFAFTFASNAVRLTPYCALAGLMDFYFVLFDGRLPIADIFCPFQGKCK